MNREADTSVGTIMTEHAFNVGVDIGGTNIKFGITNEGGLILLQHRIKTNAGSGCDTIIHSILQGIHAMLAEAPLRRESIRSIGVGVPGTADSQAGLVIYAPNLFWRNVSIGPVIEREFSVPVHIAQDTRAAAWAEYLVGAARGSRGSACVTVGTGVGCGFVFGGRIFHGALNTAGEFGHQIVEIDGESCNCGRRGCLEAHAGGLAIARQGIEQIPSIENLLNKGKNDIGVDDIYRLALNGNDAARKLTDRVVKYIGVGLVNLLNLTSVDTICISGGISNAPSELLFDPLVAFVRDRAYVGAVGKVNICKSELGEDAPMIGASLLHREFSIRQSPDLLTSATSDAR
jgi:glucokinase